MVTDVGTFVPLLAAELLPESSTDC
jgi:hypothetical protein